MNQTIIPIIPQAGWICPKCNIGVSPHEKACPHCVPTKPSGYSNTIGPRPTTPLVPEWPRPGTGHLRPRYTTPVTKSDTLIESIPAPTSDPIYPTTNREYDEDMESYFKNIVDFSK